MRYKFITEYGFDADGRRDGTVSTTLKGSMWKGSFHLPRALLQDMKVLEKMM